MNADEKFMAEAIRLSQKAADSGNGPFGAVLVKDGSIVCSDENRTFSAHDPTHHAEMGVIRKYFKETEITDLSEYTLYASCEPCFMCSGALVWAKIGRLVYGCSNADFEAVLGSDGADCSRVVFSKSYWKPEITGGIMRDEALEVIKNFFSRIGLKND